MKYNFNIYHDEDDQFLKWVNWLDKIIEKKPDIYSENIHAFINAQILIHQEDRGAQRTKAARKLLEIIGQQNPNSAFKIRSDLLEKHGIGFMDSLNGIIRGILKRSDSSIDILIQIISHLIIPFERYIDEDLILLFCRKISETTQANDVRNRIYLNRI